jgi:GT2 family glycosyltransferase
VSVKVSFIVPCLNHLAQTQQMFCSLKDTLPLGLLYEVIFVDDASTDGTRTWLAGLAEPNTKVIFNDETIGYAKANNKALTLAQGQIVGLLNNDLVFKPNWFEPMLEILESPTLRAGIVGNVQVRIADGALDHAGIEFTQRAKFEHIRQAQLRTNNTHLKTFALTGACCLIKKDTLDRVDGLSEEFLNGCEDVDLCLKIAQLGLHSYVALNSTIGHHVSLTRGVDSLQNEKNSSMLQQKWRNVLQCALSASWYSALLDPATTLLSDHFDGEVLPELLTSPFATSELIAENMLLRNEHQWARLLNESDLNDRSEIQILCAGLSSELGSEYLVAGERVRMTLKGIKSVRNFCAYGHRVDNAEQSRCHVTVMINNLQKKIFDVTNSRSFILNIEDPLLLQDCDNNFKLSIDQTPNLAEGATKGFATSPVLFTHFMLDKRFVYFPEVFTA